MSVILVDSGRTRNQGSGGIVQTHFNQKKNCDKQCQNNKQLKNWAKNNKNAKKNIKKETRLLKHYTGGMDQGQMQKSRDCKGKNGSDFS